MVILPEYIRSLIDPGFRPFRENQYKSRANSGQAI